MIAGGNGVRFTHSARHRRVHGPHRPTCSGSSRLMSSRGSRRSSSSVGAGGSTVVLARCLALNGSGHLYSLEHLPEYTRQTKAELARHGLSECATVVEAPQREHGAGAGDGPFEKGCVILRRQA
jgi:hypothetical protein